MVAGAKESPMHLSVFIPALVNLSESPFNELKSPSFGIRSVARSRLSHSLSIFLSVNMQESSTFPVSAAVRLVLWQVTTFHGWQLQSCWKFLSQDTVSKNHSAFDRCGRCPNTNLFSHLLDLSFLVLHSFSPL